MQALEPRQLYSSWSSVNVGFGIHNSFLMTDGKIMAQDWDSQRFHMLAPNALGSYTSLTDTRTANSIDGRLYYGSAVLKDGRVIVSGGEYNTGHDKIEIYDPNLNTWTAIPKPAFLGDAITDNTLKVLPDGRVLMGTGIGGELGLYNPTTNSFTQIANYPPGWLNEVSMATLADGSIFAMSTQGSDNGYRYYSSTNTWVSCGHSPVALNTGEGGPIIQLPDGKLFFEGDEQNGVVRTAIWTPPGNTTGTGTWSAGPVVPVTTAASLAADAPIAALPNGDILLPASDTSTNTVKFFTYNEGTNAFTQLTNVPAGLASSTFFYMTTLALPTGQIWMTNGGNTAYLFNPDGAPQTAWQPTVNTVTNNLDSSFTISGTQLTGISEGGVYGDDVGETTNYPMVQLTLGTNVYYAKSYGASTTAVGISAATQTVNFHVPLGVPAGTYTLKVIASGIASTGTTFIIPGAVDVAPTVATAAAVSPTTVTGTTATLSVLGADADGGEGNLVYNWVINSTTAGVSTPSYSANGTNAAKNITVTFHSKGTYSFKVYITDQYGLSVTSTTGTVTVNQSLTSLQVTPTPVNLTAGQTKQLSAAAYDQFGNSMSTSPTITWTVASGGGTISAGGLYTAPATGTLATVTASSGSASGSATIGVVNTPWTSVDVGSVNATGIAYDSGANTTLTNTGSDIWNASDQFHFDYQTLTGDGSITAKLVSQTSASSYLKVGVMIRNTLDDNSMFALTALPSQGRLFSWRSTTGGTAAQTTGASVSTPYWVRLTRVGNVFTGYVSSNGITWTQLGSPTTIAMNAQAYFGLVANSHDSNNQVTAVFSNVTVSSVATVSSVQVSPSPVNLTAGQTQQLVATAYDQNGNPLASQPTFTWSLVSGGGSVSSTGLYTAPASGGTLASVTATASGLTGNVTIGVVKASWTSLDIGSPTIGTVAYDTATTTVENGSGSDIWSTSDQFHFDYESITGNSGIIAQINSVPNVNTDATQTASAKSGVMYRSSTAANSAFVALVYSNTSGIQFIGRNSSGGVATQSGSNVAFASGALYLKLVRTAASAYSGYYSTNGVTWTLVASSFNAGLSSAALVGLAATSHDTAEVVNVTYSNVGISQPSVATAASATPNPVTGTTTALSVLGANLPNPSGESTLTYTWAATTIPSGASAPTYSANGTNAAKNTTVTFSKAGNYTFTVTITDKLGIFVTSSVNVSFGQSAATVTVSPSSTSVLTGGTVQFTASGTDQFGQPITPIVNWSVPASAGTIDSNGLFTAGTNSGTFTVTATSGTTQGTASVQVVPTVFNDTGGGDNFVIRLNPANPAQEQIIQNGTTYTITANLLTSLTFNGGIGDDSLTIDFTNGNPMPAGGVTFDGGAVGSSGNAVYVTGKASGALSFNVNGTQLSYNDTSAIDNLNYSNTQLMELDLLGTDNILTQDAQPGAALVFNNRFGPNTLTVNGGTYTLTSDPKSPYNTQLTINANSQVNVVAPAAGSGFNPYHLAALNIGASGDVALANAAANSDQSVLVLNALSIAPGGTLDLGDNAIDVHNGNAAAIAALLTQGENLPNGFWNGTGIISSTAAADNSSLTTVAMMQNSNNGNAVYGTFYGELAFQTDVFARYTLIGDADLNGVINGNDYSQIDNGYNQTAAGWINGDFNYDGQIDGSDYSLIDNAFNRQSTIPYTPPKNVVKPAVISTAAVQMNATASSEIFTDAITVKTVASVIFADGEQVSL